MKLIDLKLEKVLLTGIDPGNDGTKTTYLTNELTIESFTLPTVIAPATSDMVKVQTNHREKKEQKELDELYLHIKSKALPKGYQDNYYFVGAAALDKKERIEPESTNEENETTKHDSLLHNVLFLSSLAVAAFKTNKDIVDVPISTGLPIEEHKALNTDDIIRKYKGEHTIECKDGVYAGKKVTLNIIDGQIGVEGITSVLALEFDIQDGELVETEFAENLQTDFALADLGAGTLDLAIYENGELKQYDSTNKFIGTNSVIDQLIDTVTNLPEFERIRNRFARANVKVLPYRTRQEFIDKVIKPEIHKMIDDSTYSPCFIVEWGGIQKDVSALVLNKMIEYGQKVEEELINFWALVPQLNNFVLVGGGVLFGYPHFKNLDDFILSPNLKESAHYTSKAYLLANIISQAD